MSMLNLAAFRATTVQRAPFEYLIVPGFIRVDARTAFHDAFPVVDRPGSFPLSELTFGGAFQQLIYDLQGPAKRSACEGKFKIDLTHPPDQTLCARSGATCCKPVRLRSSAAGPTAASIAIK
jgi:hypothetical protein